jgi:hypothetical protein
MNLNLSFVSNRKAVLRGVSSVFLLIGTGCSPRQTDTEWLGTIDTLSNGAVLVRNPDVGLWDSVSGWTMEIETQIGPSDDGPSAFGFVRDFDADPAGRIYVLDGQANEIRMFNPDGGFLRSFGRSGEGPGEFQRAAGLVVRSNGTTLVADPMLGRYTLFDSTGTVLRTASPGVVISSWYLVFPWPGAIDSLGNVYDFTGTSDGPRLLRFGIESPESQVRDTIAVPALGSTELLLKDGQGRVRASMPAPYATQILTYVDPTGFLWLGDNAEYRIVKRSFTGDTVQIIERSYRREPITQAEIDSAMAPAATFLANGGTADGPPRPEHKPAYRWFIADDQGYLWISGFERRRSTGTVLDVFDPSGKYLGAVDTGIQIDDTNPPVVRNNRLYAAVKDAQDVQYVVAVRIVGR